MITWSGYEWGAKMHGTIIHPGQPWMWYSEECAVVDEYDTLHLLVKEDPREVKHWNGNTYYPKYAVGTLRSAKAFDYGTFSAEIVCPEGFNLWPSFWLTGKDAWPPEIDIMEAWSEDDDYFKWMIAQFPYILPSWRTTNNVHYNKIVDGEYVKTSIGSRNVSWFKQHKDPTSHFIKYECVWEPDKIQIKTNNRVVRTVSKKVANMLTENIKDGGGHEMYVIFNLWMEDPDKYRIEQYSDMQIRNFEYKPI